MGGSGGLLLPQPAKKETIRRPIKSAFGLFIIVGRKIREVEGKVSLTECTG
jgi:hypothetical protein